MPAQYVMLLQYFGEALFKYIGSLFTQICYMLVGVRSRKMVWLIEKLLAAVVLEASKFITDIYNIINSNNDAQKDVFVVIVAVWATYLNDRLNQPIGANAHGIQELRDELGKLILVKDLRYRLKLRVNELVYILVEGRLKWIATRSRNRRNPTHLEISLRPTFLLFLFALSYNLALLTVLVLENTLKSTAEFSS